MAISIFPSTAAEFVSNNFVIDMNDTSNNSVTLENVKQAGTYNISVESGDTSFDIYLLDNDGALVAYTNTTTVAPTGLFQIVVVLGVADSEIISFSYAGNVNNADGEGDQPGAAAYLTSITPSDLPSIDDTATVAGGNFGANTEITFESGATVLSAKNIVVTNSTELVVTRPDGLIEDDAPYTLRAVTTGVAQPTGTNANILTDAVTAGSDPTWVTTSPLNTTSPGVAFSQTLEATDSDGTVVDYSVTAGTITPGLTLDSSTGVLSGTPTTGGNFTFTVTATDDGGNTTPREFEQLVAVASGGDEFESGGFKYHLFKTTDDFELFVSEDIEYLIVAGGGSAGGGSNSLDELGGGGAGGVLSGTFTGLAAGTYTATIGAGGQVPAGESTGNNGSNSSFNLITSTGGGGGGFNGDGQDGGSGGGAAQATFRLGGEGIPGQGNDGSDGVSDDEAGGGGGAGAAAVNTSNGGDGTNAFSTWATAVNLVFDGGYFAGGGGAGGNSGFGGTGGLGGGGNGADGIGSGDTAPANSGGGGGGAFGVSSGDRGSGGSGVVIVRYAS